MPAAIRLQDDYSAEKCVSMLRLKTTMAVARESIKIEKRAQLRFHWTSVAAVVTS
jgi:hypothetical protein